MEMARHDRSTYPKWNSSVKQLTMLVEPDYCFMCSSLEWKHGIWLAQQSTTITSNLPVCFGSQDCGSWFSNKHLSECDKWKDPWPPSKLDMMIHILMCILFKPCLDWQLKEWFKEHHNCQPPPNYTSNPYTKSCKCEVLVIMPTLATTKTANFSYTNIYVFPLCPGSDYLFYV